METIAILLVISLVLLVGWTVVRRPRWRAVWPMLLTPAPWALLLALIVAGRGYSRPVEGWSAEFHPVRWTPLVMLAATLALSIWAISRAKDIEWPAAGLVFVNALVAFAVAALAVFAIEAIVL